MWEPAKSLCYWAKRAPDRIGRACDTAGCAADPYFRSLRPMGRIAYGRAIKCKGQDMPTARMVDAIWAKLVIEDLQGRNISPAGALLIAGLSLEQIEEPDARIRFSSHVKLLEAAAELTGDVCYALRLARRLSPGDAGLLGYVATNSATLGDAFGNIARYVRVMSDGGRLDIEDHADVTHLVFYIINPKVKMNRQAIEFIAGGISRFIQVLGGDAFDLLGVDFFHSEPVDAFEHAQLLGCQIRFAQPSNKIMIASKLLSRPVEGADPSLLRILERYCDDIIARRPDPNDLASVVTAVVAKTIPYGRPPADAVAREVGMSRRTFTRRLETLGTTYLDLVEQARKELAIRYLRDDDMRISQIAYMLGYAELSSFNHAFRRWFGVTPSDFRISS